MSLILFQNAKLLDPTKPDLEDGVSVLVEGAASGRSRPGRSGPPAPPSSTWAAGRSCRA